MVAAIGWINSGGGIVATDVLTIVLGDRHPLFQEAVRSVLEGEPDLRVVATAGDGNRAIVEAERHRPQIALLSANLLNCDGFSATALIRSRVPTCRVVILAGDRDNAALARAIEAGASGYLPQDCPLTEVIAAIHAVHCGDVLIPPNSFALCETVEYVSIPRDMLAICVGKSTYARCGIIVNVTPFEPEWEGHVTLEISNTTPLPAKIYANEGLAQVLFFRAARVCEISYADRGGKYQKQQGITPPLN